MNLYLSERAARLVERVGFPAFIALLLLALVVSTLLPIKSSLESHTRGDAVRTYLLRRICLNTSATKADSDGCIQEMSDAVSK